MAKVQDFLGIEKVIDEDNFYFDNEKGMFCTISPNKPPKCIGDGKGRSSKYSVDRETKLKLHEFLNSFNQELFQMLAVAPFDWNFFEEPPIIAAA